MLLVIITFTIYKAYLIIEMSDKIVTLVTYMFPTEAYPLMTQLELEGIECFLGDENIVSVQPFLSNAVGGVKVKIKECDSEKALLVLNQLTQNKKKEELRIKAEQDQKDYDSGNYRDDQFDLSDALLAIAIALLAVTALTHQRWLYFVALIPTGFGAVMGLAGLLGWAIHPAGLIRLLSRCLSVGCEKIFAEAPSRSCIVVDWARFNLKCCKFLV